jgi:hypothetical protein
MKKNIYYSTLKCTNNIELIDTHLYIQSTQKTQLCIEKYERKINRKDTKL